jgi:hypothetical protein
MPTGSPSPDVAVDLVADVLAGLVESTPGRNYAPGADLTTSPAVGIAPGWPWAEWRVLGREHRVHWTIRLIVGRWESGPSIDVALATWVDASPPLRAAGFDVGPLDPPQAMTIGQTVHLLASFPVTYAQKAA